MKNKVASKYAKNNNQLICISNKVSDIEEDFLKLTEYAKDEIMDKGIFEVFVNLLRVSPHKFEQLDLEGKMTSFLFTKTLQVREVTITTSYDSNHNKKKYTIVEKPNSRMEEKFPYIEQLYIDNKSGIAIYSADLIMLKANKTFLNFMEEPFDQKENCMGRTIFEIFKGLKGSKVEDNWRKISKTGESFYTSEFVYEFFDRGVTYWDASTIPIYEKGKIKYLVHNTIEVTERVLDRKRIEEQQKIIEAQNTQLMKQKELLKRQYGLLNLSNEAIFAWELDGAIIYWNTGCERMYGYKSEEAVGCVSHNLLKTVHPPHSKDIVSVLRRDRAWNGEVEHTSKEGKKLIIKTNKQVMINGQGQHIVLETNRDITEHKDMEKELLCKKEELEVIIQNMSDGLIVCDPEGKFILMNSTAKKMIYQIETVKQVGEFLNKTTCLDIDGNPVQLEELPLKRALRGENVKNCKLIMQTPDTQIIIDVNASPVYDEKGALRMAIACNRDITDLMMNQREIKNHQEQLINIEKEKNDALRKAMDMKDEFLSLISHEFKTPITVIHSAIQAMEYICKDEITDKIKGFINKIRQNSLRQLRLVNNLLDITRMSAGHIKINKENHDIVFLTKIIVESIYVYTQQKGVQVSFVPSSAKKIIGVDEEKYERILLNLLSNAIKFTPKGKNIWVIISSQKEFVSIKVKDEGIGMPENKQKIIFERFGQVDSSLSRQAEGSGIGLHLVKKFVESLDGSISVESKEGMGSTFTVRLPNKKVATNLERKTLQEISDHRLIQSTAIEFSDIYLK